MITKLLCIDDDETTLLLIRMVVEKARFAKEIKTCKSAQEALGYYQNILAEQSTEAPQLIFLDLNMPVMSGWDFLDEFISTYYPKFNQTQIVILSSSTNIEDRNKARQYPAIIGYIPKPITADLLKKLVK
ncbi:response regulator [Emticicia sp. 17c]|uniref:response regulator n=1 Tax=Emticicia sp. 17c TaxID=3127704 RepID=UPI00301BA483